MSGRQDALEPLFVGRRFGESLLEHRAGCLTDVAGVRVGRSDEDLVQLVLAIVLVAEPQEGVPEFGDDRRDLGDDRLGGERLGRLGRRLSQSWRHASVAPSSRALFSWCGLSSKGDVRIIA
jgi:hypothetical protein